MDLPYDNACIESAAHTDCKVDAPLLVDTLDGLIELEPDSLSMWWAEQTCTGASQVEDPPLAVGSTPMPQEQ